MTTSDTDCIYLLVDHTLDEELGFVVLGYFTSTADAMAAMVYSFAQHRSALYEHLDLEIGDAEHLTLYRRRMGLSPDGEIGAVIGSWVWTHVYDAENEQHSMSVAPPIPVSDCGAADATR